MKEAVPRMKITHKEMCRNSTEEKKNRHKSMKNKAKKRLKSREREG